MSLDPQHVDFWEIRKDCQWAPSSQRISHHPACCSPLDMADCHCYLVVATIWNRPGVVRAKPFTAEHTSQLLPVHWLVVRALLVWELCAAAANYKGPTQGPWMANC